MTAVGDEQRAFIGLSQEQAKAVADARAEQSTQSLNADEEKALELALATLSREVDLSQAQITHRRVQAVNWPDSSLGCPLPGQSYLQVITPGYLVSFSAAGESYTVHVGAGNAVICDRIAGELKARRLRGQNIMKVYRAAQVDLAERLKIDPSEITITGMKPTTWDDSSLGCPQPSKNYSQTAVEGFVINMECRGRQYEYHSDNEGNEFVSCDELESCYDTE
jgi:hypothetical protein